VAAILAITALVLAGLLVLRGERAGQLPEVAGEAFVADVNSRTAVVWAVGDGPDGGTAAQRVAELIAADRVTARVLYLGDTYEDPDDDESEELSGSAGPAEDGEGGPIDNWTTRFAGAYGRLASITAPTPGNHDWPEEAEAGYLRFWRQLVGRQVPSYYSFTVAGWEILSLNSEAPHEPGSNQLKWLNEQVSEPGNCRIAFWHRPRFSAGDRHGDQEDTDPLWEAVEGRAAIVLGGHEHNMQRFEPMSGTTQFISGAGGHSHYGVHEDDARLAFSNDTDYGALRLELTLGAASWKFVTVDGKTIDSGRLACRPLDGD
jgi:hypothetical protein